VILIALNDGNVSSTGTVTCNSGIVGGVLISVDGTNAAVVTMQKDTSGGKTVFDISTKQPLFITGPISLEGTTALYYSVTGTGALAQFYEWVE
jgi:hypothetical protein